MTSGEITKSLHGNINSDFVSIFETIRDGLCRGIHPYINPFHSVHFDTFGKRTARESGNTKAWIIQVRLPGFRW